MSALGDRATGGKITSILKLLNSDIRINSDIAITKFNIKPLTASRMALYIINLKTGELYLKPQNFENTLSTLTLI